MIGSTCDPSRCPLCLHPNECGMVDGIGTCWCFESSVSRERVDRTPFDADCDACLCQTCLLGSLFPGFRLDAILDAIRVWR